MSLKSNAYFSQMPSVRLSRSAIDRSHTVKTTWNNGDLIPIYVDEILPGDTVSMDVSSVVRMSTPIKPIMDNLVMDVYFFFVPNRLVWDHWKEFMGEVSSGYWTPSVEYTVPQVNVPQTLANSSVWYKEVPIDSSRFSEYVTHANCSGQPLYIGISSSPYYQAVSSTDTFDPTAKYYYRYQGWSPYSLASYFGYPIGCNSVVVDDSNNDAPFGMSVLPLRAYGLVWNEYFRDQNYMDPVNIDKSSDSNIDGVDALRGDHWTGSAISGETPTEIYNYVTDTIKGARPLRVCRFHDYFSSGLPQPQRGSAVDIPFGISGLAPVMTSSQEQNWTSSSSRDALKFKSIYGGTSISGNWLGMTSNRQVAAGSSTGAGTFSPSVQVSPSNLYADVDSVITPGTINDLRTAFQVQKFLECSARSGTRYTEMIQGFFGVKNPDARLQRPEFLGWKRNYINVTQVLQTSSSDTITPQGNTAAYSLTTNKDSIFTKSFTEHGILLGLCACRTTRSYQSGVNKMWARRRKFDYYFPQFAHLGEEPILNREIFCYTGRNGNVEKSYARKVFAYQERYSEYRYHPDIVTGDMSSYGPQSLDLWHFADYYTWPVYASREWLLEGPENVDRTLAVTSSLSHQFIGDFYFKAKFVRPMPLYSIPGLADHF